MLPVVANMISGSFLPTTHRSKDTIYEEFSLFEILREGDFFSQQKFRDAD